MGLFDFFKQKKQTPKPSDRIKEAAVDSNEDSGPTILYETELSARDLTKDLRLIQQVVDKMVAEDPFKHYYSAETPGTSPRSPRLYEYGSITTMNVDLAPGAHTNLQVSIEGILLGALPSEKAQEIEPYREKHVLTAYAFVTGGRYKEITPDTHEIQEGMEPYDVKLFLQFTG